MVELRRFYERFRTTLPTNNVQKRFIAKKVSGTMQNVKVDLKVEVMNDVALGRQTGPWSCRILNGRSWSRWMPFM